MYGAKARAKVMELGIELRLWTKARAKVMG